MDDAATKPMVTIGLLGQPNTGKSTLFNSLTGSRQHVGNWPGKTVEQKSGLSQRGRYVYQVVDLPGAYSLTANSEEELVTREFIASGTARVILILIDASQLERSMYLLADYAGINLPAVAVFNMTDVATQNGKQINYETIEAKLGIPVIPMVATRKGAGSELLTRLERAVSNEGIIETNVIERKYREAFGITFDTILNNLPEGGIGNFSALWIAVKLLEGDPRIGQLVHATVTDAQWRAIQGAVAAHPDGALAAAGCKYEWISSITDGAARQAPPDQKRNKRWFDRIAIHPLWGRPLALFLMILGFAVSMVIAAPLMGLTFGLMPLLCRGTAQVLAAANAPPFLISLLTEAAIPGAFMTLFMVIYVSGVTLVFGLMEDIGYLARVAYVFDGVMGKIGLHGKAAMPFMMSLGCNIAGVTGTRVIDTWRQRFLTIATSWVVPCTAMWGVIGLVANLFFGKNAVWVIIVLFGFAVLHIKLTAWFFGKVLLKEAEPVGMIMELPPYHKPNWKTIFGYVWGRMKIVCAKSFKVIVGVSVLVWVLSYSRDGKIEHSLIYPAGKFLEPFGALFGLDWRLFAAFLFSIMGKEAALGVISMLFGIGGGISSFAGNMVQGAFQGDQAGLATAMTTLVSPAAALAFLFAFFFNVPCMAAIASARVETISWKWTAALVGYYIGMALLIGGVAYRLGALIF
jgi:ferrous iron transport protein B